MRDGRYYYGESECDGPDGAYRRFRDSWNGSVGRAAYKRLNRVGSRRERIHGRGFVFVEPFARTGNGIVVPVTLLGLVTTSYCWSIDGRDIPGVCDDDVWGWVDRILERGSGMTRSVTERRKPIKKRYGR